VHGYYFIIRRQKIAKENTPERNAKTRNTKDCKIQR